MNHVANVCLSIFLIFFGTTSAAKVLGVFPIEAKSHYIFNRAIMKVLADAGHSVTIISPFPEQDPPKNVHYVDSRQQTSGMRIENIGADQNLKYTWWYDAYVKFTKHFEPYCYNVQELPFVQDLLRSEYRTYDIVFIDMIFMHECFLTIARRLRLPVIGTFACRRKIEIDERFGNPHSWTIPLISTNLPQRMTFWQRVKNTYNHILMTHLLNKAESNEMRNFYQKHFPDQDIERNKKTFSLLFSNTHASIFPTPIVPNIIEIAGIHLKRAKALPQDIQKFIEEADHGVILFSFGSWIRGTSLESKFRDIFKNTFANLSQRIIWKFEEEIENITPNVLLQKWVPQYDILAHKNVKLFMTHCGIHGLYEAIDTATPTILLPITGDQPSNAVRLEELGVGLSLNWTGLSNEQILLNAINSILTDESYSKKMQHLSRIFKDRPMSPQESVVYWTEYVLRYNGAKHLRTTAADMPFYQYFLLDVLFFVVTIIIFGFFAMYFIIRKIYRFFYRNSRTNLKIKQN